MDNLMLGWLVRQFEDERVQSLISDPESSTEDSEEEDAADASRYNEERVF
jgi:hypothetical protein